MCEKICKEIISMFDLLQPLSREVKTGCYLEGGQRVNEYQYAIWQAAQVNIVDFL